MRKIIERRNNMRNLELSELQELQTLLKNQINLIAEWNSLNINNEPEQCRRNVETISHSLKSLLQIMN